MESCKLHELPTSVCVIDRVGGGWVAFRKQKARFSDRRGSEMERPGNDDVVISNHLPVSGNFSSTESR